MDFGFAGILVLSTIFSGEIGVHVLGVFIAKNQYNFFGVLILVIILQFLVEFIIFLIVKKYEKSSIVEKLHHIHLHRLIQKLSDKLAHMGKRGMFWVLFIIKFLPASKLLIIPYTLFFNIQVKTFIIFNLIVNIIWASVVLLSGYLIGANILSSFHLKYSLEIAVYAVIVIIIIMVISSPLKKFINSVIYK